MKSRFKNPKLRAKRISVSLKDRILSREHVENIKRGLAKYYENSGVNSMKDKKHTSKSKKLMSKNAAAKRPEIKEKIRRSHLKRYIEDPSLRKRISELTKKGMKKVNMSEVVKNAYKNNPSYRDKIIKARLKQIFPKKDTKIELKIQEELKSRKIKFIKHKILLDRFKVDIFIRPNIVIECDGCYYHACKLCNMTEHHQYAPEKDAKKTKMLRENDYVVYRFWGHEINNSVKKCVNTIKEIKNCKTNC